MSGAPCRYSSLEGIEGNISVTAYVARQKWSYVYDADTALREGSIFPELVEAYRVKEGEMGEGD